MEMIFFRLVAYLADLMAMSFGPFGDDKGTFMQDLLGVDPKAVIEEITMVRCGTGSNIELFKYAAPDQKDLQPKNSDIGGFQHRLLCR